MKVKVSMILALVLMVSFAMAQWPVDKPPKGEHYDINFVVKPMFSDTFAVGLD